MSRTEKADQLIADQLKSELPDVVIGREIIVLQQTSSTNDAILQVISPQEAAVSVPASVTEGLVVFSEHQTAGRGQRGNRWESAAGKGLWFSILLRPEIHIHESGRITRWALASIADVIRSECALELAMKAPNAVQVCCRKGAGVLLDVPT